jgi:hypothetical protein
MRAVPGSVATFPWEVIWDVVSRQVLQSCMESTALQHLPMGPPLKDPLQNGLEKWPVENPFSTRHFSAAEAYRLIH